MRQPLFAFLGLRCGVPPRQIQNNNDASGSPQRVAGAPSTAVRFSNRLDIPCSHDLTG